MAKNESFIWQFFIEAGFTEAGVAGLMGNLIAESALDPINLENSKNQSLHMTDTEYTKKVDNNTYTNFIHDRAGYGLAQWTWWTRKQALLSYARRTNRSIGDLTMQLEFLLDELRNHYLTTVYKVLMTSNSVQEASDAVLLNFEQPYNQGQNVLEKRASFGMNFYNKYSKKGANSMAHQIYKKGQGVQLSANFNSREMDCHGNGCCTETPVDPRLVQYLQNIRDHFKKSLTITSGYRCPAHNRNVGGATGSRHSKGDAADIVVQGVAPREVAKYAESIGILGIGLYETSHDGFFVHIDTRDYKSFWYGQAQQPRSTFGGTPGSIPSTPTQPTQRTVLGPGDHGDDVKKLQQDLIDLGYNVGKDGADGWYGQNTVNAVMAFQEDVELKEDGYAGPDTLNAIEKALSDNGANDKKVMTVTATGLNVRAGGSMNAPVIGMVYKGQKVTVLEQKEGWGKIEQPAGWVSMTYLK